MGNFSQNCHDCLDSETAPIIPTIADFQIIRQIGEGAFSQVYLVKKKDTNMFLALKVMQKAEIIRKNLKSHIERESAILQEVDNPFIIILHYAFQDMTKLYLALEFMQGGQLFQHLQKFKQNEKMIQFYAAEIVLALEYLHQKQILYRDLKPENILFGIDGHIKLTDFGLSKIGDGKTICGSEFYLAPEILKRKYLSSNQFCSSHYFRLNNQADSSCRLMNFWDITL